MGVASILGNIHLWTTTCAQCVAWFTCWLMFHNIETCTERSPAEWVVTSIVQYSYCVIRLVMTMEDIYIPKISITRNDGYVLSIDPSLVMGFSENMVDIPLNHTQMIIFPKKNSHKSYTSHYGTSRMFEYVEPSHIKFGPLLRKKWHSQTRCSVSAFALWCAKPRMLCPATAGEVTFSFWESHAKNIHRLQMFFADRPISNKFLPRCSNGKVILFSSLVAPQEYRSPSFYLVSSEYNIQVAKSYIKLI